MSWASDAEWWSLYGPIERIYRPLVRFARESSSGGLCVIRVVIRCQVSFISGKRVRRRRRERGYDIAERSMRWVAAAAVRSRVARCALGHIGRCGKIFIEIVVIVVVFPSPDTFPEDNQGNDYPKTEDGEDRERSTSSCLVCQEPMRSDGCSARISHRRTCSGLADYRDPCGGLIRYRSRQIFGDWQRRGWCLCGGNRSDYS